MRRWHVFVAMGLMALFAELNPTNKVLRVVVSPLASTAGETFMANLVGGRWKETAIDGSIRSTYAGKGYWLDGVADTFAATLTQSKVAMLGDSIIAQMVGVQSAMPSPFTGATNLGVSGQTTAQIAARVGSIAASATHVMIEGGVNDYILNNSGAAIVAGYTTMLNAIPSTKRVILLGLPQVDEAVISPADNLTNASINAANAQLITLCNSYPNCIPATAWMTMNRNGKTADGLHFTAASYQDFATAVLTLF